MIFPVIFMVLFGVDLISGFAINSTSEPATENAKYYLGTSKRVSWYKAYFQCKQLGMNLVSIKSQAEHDEITKLITDGGFNDVSFWTSGTKQGNGQDFYWMDNGYPITYENFCYGEPNGRYADGEVESCIELWHDRNHQWGDQICSNKLFFVCEREQAKIDRPFKVSTDNGKYYFNMISKLNWYMANRQCRNLGMDLISIDSEEKQQELVNILKDKGYNHHDFWTSGTLRADDYHWMGNGKKFTYTNWYQGEPNEAIVDEEGERCVQLQLKNEYTWNDDLCSKKLYFICEQNHADDSNMISSDAGSQNEIDTQYEVYTQNEIDYLPH